MSRAARVAGVVTVAVAAVVAAVYSLSGSRRPETGTSTNATARRAPLRITVTASGTVKAKQSKDIRTGLENRAEVVWLVDEGKEVKEGDLLVELDKKELQRQYDQGEIQVAQYQTEYDAAKTALEVQAAENESNGKKAALKVERTEKELEKYRDGEAPGERRKLLLAIEKAESDHARARDRFRDMPELEKEGFVTKDQVEEERMKVRTLEIEVETARLALALFDKYTDPLALRQKEADFEEARSELDRTKKTSESQLRQKEAAVKQKERQLASARDQHERTKKNLEKCTIRAPHDGIVVYGNPDQPWMRSEIKVGMTIWQNQTFLTLPDLSELQVLGNVHETDINKVAEGLGAFATPETEGGTVFPGKVTKVARLAQSGGGWDDDVKRFPVEVTLDGRNLGIRPGTSAKVEILVEEVPDALQIPIQAIFAEAGESFVWIASAEGPTRRTVKPGKQNLTHVEIEDGLREGEVVLLHSPEAEAAARPKEAEIPRAAGGVPEEESGAPRLPAAGS